MRASIKAVMFDFGGVMAEEGFVAGLKAIAAKNKMDQDGFFRIAEELIYESGYLTGRTDEAHYWRLLRERTGIKGADKELRNEIVKRFTIRPAMIRLVDLVRAKGLTTVLLSDQTNWLEEIDQATHLFSHFDRVFNSIRINMSKREAGTFAHVAGFLNIPASQILFVDDNRGHIDRAIAAGFPSVHFVTIASCEMEVSRLTGIR